MTNPQPVIEVFVLTHHDVHEGTQHTDVVQAQAIFNANNPEATVTISALQYEFDSSSNTEYEGVKAALVAADPNSYVIVCKDSSVSAISASLLIRRLVEVIQNESFDIMWLAKWLDQCQKHVGKRLVGERGMYVTDTYNPHGIQCLMFSPEGREKFLCREPLKPEMNLSEVLAQAVSVRIFKAITFQPCPISYDISRAEKPVDYVKTCECADPPGVIKPDRPGSNIGFFIFIAVGVFVAIAIFLLIRFGLYMSMRYDMALTRYVASSSPDRLAP